MEKVPTASSMHSTARLSNIKIIPPEAPTPGKIVHPVNDPPHKPRRIVMGLIIAIVFRSSFVLGFRVSHVL
jgi:hypothetical protein